MAFHPLRRLRIAAVFWTPVKVMIDWKAAQALTSAILADARTSTAKMSISLLPSNVLIALFSSSELFPDPN
jgi:hypothetical protein